MSPVLTNFVWLVVQPLHVIVLIGLVGLVLSVTRWRSAGHRVLIAAFALLAIAGLTPLGALLIGTLEARFPAAKLTPPIDGIILISGAEQPRMSRDHGQVLTNSYGDRLIAAARLAHRFPDARIAVTGGVLALDRTARPEFHSQADVARRFLTSVGIDPARIVVERQSQNTCQNARHIHTAVTPEPDDRWVVVTSAFHMPRTMGCFDKVGWTVIAYPTDYKRISGPKGLRPTISVAGNLSMLNQAVHEYVGLLAYRVTGQIDALFPGPE